MLTTLLTRLLLCLALLLPLASLAEEQPQDNQPKTEEHWYNYDHLYAYTGTYIHFSPSDDHEGPRVFAALEAVKASDWLYGLGLFNNSFGQFSQYLYGGKIWKFHDRLEGFQAKVTFGLIHGYKGEFKDKIPFNNLGVAPAIIPGIGYKKHGITGEVVLLGAAGLLFTVGMDF